MLPRWTPVMTLACLSVGACDRAVSPDASTTSGEPGTGGGPNDVDSDGGPDSEAFCREDVRVLNDLHEVGALGRAGAYVVEAVSGSYTGGVRWIGDGIAGWHGPLAPAELTLELTYHGGEIRDIDAVAQENCQNLAGCWWCIDRLEIEMRLRLTSSDGVLDESWTVPVRFTATGEIASVEDITVEHAFDPDATMGMMSRAYFSSDAEIVVRHASLAGNFRHRAFRGTVGVVFDVVGGPGAGAAGAEVVADLAALVDVSPSACAVLDEPFACDAVGCVPVTGRSVHGVPPDQCGCGAPATHCFARAPHPDGPPDLYVRPDDGTGLPDRVVAFDVPIDVTGTPWQPCAEVEDSWCACFGGAGTCP